MWVGTGIHMPAYPTGPKRPRHKQHSRTHKRHKRMPADAKEEEEDKKRLLGPGQRVQFLLNQDAEDGGGITGSDVETRRIFTEMVELADGQQEWRETARWVKFEEDVEEGGNRWSKPHVATLSLHSLFELRSCLLTGAVVLDLEATELTQVVGKILFLYENKYNLFPLKLASFQ
uniref:Band 3 cytoplasmic domain-containing protein n=1 Tax=Romanomermis culicivorax TaxID=13658 RepID=A0A915J1J5_ROMCU